MDIVNQLWGAMSVPLMILIVLGALLALFKVLTNRYVKVPPQKALIVYGGAKTRVVSGGAKFVVPFRENYFYMDLSLFQFEIDLNNVPNADSVPVNVRVGVSAKVSNKEDLLPVASGVFGEAKLSDIRDKVKGVVDGSVRSLVGQLDMDTILRNQDKFKEQIANTISIELTRIGCEIVVLNIQEVSDPNGVIQALGKPEIAKVKAQAAIQEAEQNRRETVDVTNAQMEGQKVRAANEGMIAQAQRDLQIKQAGYAAEVNREQAKANQAGPLAAAEAQRAVVTATVAVSEAETVAQIALQSQVRTLTQAKLEATLITEAEAKRKEVTIKAEGQRAADLITADGQRQKQVIEAEGAARARGLQAEAHKQAVQLEGEGDAARVRTLGAAQADATKSTMVADAEGKQAQAAAVRATLEAEAAGKSALAEATRLELLAKAEGTKAQGLAEAASKEASLAADASGITAMANVLRGLTPEQQKMLRTKWVLEMLPHAIAQLGDAGEKIMGRVAEPIAAALGSIDQVHIYDSGAAGADSGLQRYAKVAPQAMMQVIQSLRETGMSAVVVEALKKLGVDLDAFGGDK